MSNYRTIGEVEEQYLRDHPDEVDDYMTVLFDEYAESGDTAALLSSLRVVSRVKGVSRIAEISGLSRKGLQKAIMHAMGYRLAPQKLPEPTHAP